MEIKETGKTQSVGFQIGVRRTLALSQEEAWERVIAPDGLSQWLGGASNLRLEPGSRYVTGTGAQGEMRIVKPREQLRFTWQQSGWARPSTVQIRFIPGASRKTTVSFHQEHLADAAARAEMKRHWEQVLDQLRGLE